MSDKKKNFDNRYFNRRQFLAGSGSLLMLPPLLSLMPSQVAAQVVANPRRRSVSWYSVNGLDNYQLQPKAQTDLIKQAGSSVYTKPLANFSGNISRLIDADFVSMYPYMNLIQGLSHTGGGYAGHSFATLSAGHKGELDNSYGASIDYIMEKSANVYKTGDSVPNKAIRLFTSDADSQHTFYFSGGKKTVTGGIQGDKNLFNTLFKSFTGSGTATVNDDKTIVDRVYADLKALQSNTRISAEDKLVLAQYVNSIYELQLKVGAASTAPACAKPTMSFQASKDGNYWWMPDDGWGITNCGAMYDNYIELLRLAFVCDLTRVVTVGCTLWTDEPINRDTGGGLHHDVGSSDKQADRHKWHLKKFLKLAKALQGTTDPFGGGNLLDNSIMLWTNELGDWTEGHSVLDMPVVTFGKGGGRINTGHYIDYRQKPLPNYYQGNPGRPYKQVLQSVMASMGVTKAEYSLWGDGQGFGDFVPSINQFGAVYKDIYAVYKNEHNDPLPFFYTGT